jgi:RHS repeat-associated protein
LLTTMADPRGSVHTFSYDTDGRLVQTFDPAGGSKTLMRTVGANGYMVALSTALGRMTTYTVERLPEGSERSLITFPTGLQDESVTDPGGTQTTRQPDGTQRTVVPGADPRWGVQVPILRYQALSLPSGLVLTTTTGRRVILPDPNNLLSLAGQTDTTNINSEPYVSDYAANTQTITNTTPAGRSRTTTLDAQGRAVAEQAAGFFPASYSYDAGGRLSTITRGSGAVARTIRLEYDEAGHLAKVTDPLGRSTRFGYDAAGRVTSQALPGGRLVQYAYDANGNLTRLTPPGRPAHTFTYTPLDLLEAYQPPEVGDGAPPNLSVYDADQQLSQVMRPSGGGVMVGYDSTGRRISLTSPSGTAKYEYDPSTGNVAAITAPQALGVTLSYDGSLPTGEAWTGVITGSVASIYDANLRVTAQYLNGGDPVSFEYDADGLLTRSGDLLVILDPQTGLPVQIKLGDVTETLTYNGFGEVTSSSTANRGSVIYAVHYARDSLGRLTHKTETIAGVMSTETYTYDAAGHLTRVAQNGHAVAAYTYDANGNRASALGRNGPISARYDAQDRLLQYGRTGYTYTANGELRTSATGNQSTTYDYDGLGNLVGVTLPDRRQLGYLVDGRNRRVGKLINRKLVQGFLYQDGLRPVAELNGANAVVSRFIYAGSDSVPTYMIKGGVTYRIIADQLGSARLVVETATGRIIQRLDYYAFGRVLVDTNPGFQPFGFGGGLYDPDTRFVRFGVRDYDPETGRWTTKDPMLFAGGDPNLYGYVHGDPVNRVDPLGAFERLATLAAEADQRAFLAGRMTAEEMRANTRARAAGVGIGLAADLALFGRAIVAGLVNLFSPEVAATSTAAACGAANLAGKVSPKDLDILVAAAQRAGGPGAFMNDLGALAETVAAKVPGGQVWNIGNLSTSQIWGTVRTGVGIVDINGVTTVVRALPGRPVEILGPLH